MQEIEHLEKSRTERKLDEPCNEEKDNKQIMSTYSY